MNVIISNKYQSMLDTLDIDVIKSLNGEFEVDEIINTFSNFYFNKMILDITAIKNYQDITNIQKLSVNFDMNKVILVLEEVEDGASSIFISKLISMGIYNFTRNIDNLKYLIDNPNSYKDVAHLQQLDGNDTGVVSSQIVESAPSLKVIGFQNLTDSAGATSLIYMLKKQLSQNYKVLGVELLKNDFFLFGDKELVSIPIEDLANFIMKNNNCNIILIDLNGAQKDIVGICHDIIYLVEPSTIKLNRLIRKNRNVFSELKGSKIVLNQSLLNKKDISDFEFESKSNIFFNIPPLDDKVEGHKILDEFAAKLGFIKQNPASEGKDKKNKGLFRF